MAKYLRPRRGSQSNAHSQNIKLQKGELFMEFPNGYIGKEPGRLVIGDGASSYHSISYATSATNVFQPFITDPSIYIPRFANTATSTGSGTISAAMDSIEKIGNGSSTSAIKLPTIISAIKEALVYHGNSITKLNNDLGDINDSINDINTNINNISTVISQGTVNYSKNSGTANNAEFAITSEELYNKKVVNGSTGIISATAWDSLVNTSPTLELKSNNYNGSTATLTNHSFMLYSGNRGISIYDSSDATDIMRFYGNYGWGDSLTSGWTNNRGLNSVISNIITLLNQKANSSTLSNYALKSSLNNYTPLSTFNSATNTLNNKINAMDITSKTWTFKSVSLAPGEYDNEIGYNIDQIASVAGYTCLCGVILSTGSPKVYTWGVTVGDTSFKPRLFNTLTSEKTVDIWLHTVWVKGL